MAPAERGHANLHYRARLRFRSHKVRLDQFRSTNIPRRPRSALAHELIGWLSNLPTPQLPERCTAGPDWDHWVP